MVKFSRYLPTCTEAALSILTPTITSHNSLRWVTAKNKSMKSVRINYLNPVDILYDLVFCIWKESIVSAQVVPTSRSKKAKLVWVLFFLCVLSCSYSWNLCFFSELSCQGNVPLFFWNKAGVDIFRCKVEGIYIRWRYVRNNIFLTFRPLPEHRILAGNP